VSLCQGCGGSGRKIVSGSPYKTKKCSRCNGWRTRGSGKMNAAVFKSVNKFPKEISINANADNGCDPKKGLEEISD